METDILKKLYDAVNRVLSPDTKGVLFREALEEFDSIVSSDEISSETLKKLGFNGFNWLRTQELKDSVARQKKNVPRTVLSNNGIEEKMEHLKAKLEEILHL